MFAISHRGSLALELQGPGSNDCIEIGDTHVFESQQKSFEFSTAKSGGQV